MLGDLNERAISLQEVREAVNEIKSGKAPGSDAKKNVFLASCFFFKHFFFFFIFLFKNNILESLLNHVKCLFYYFACEMLVLLKCE